ncbi:hypothetical protein HO173_003711 [Letharia columbiana]|uniref:Uncharacterized protein n=1 Tax=Letharia columbiana TaxID=112416 RepID=A0A8H6L705_9LECA|nr:uncharacterized protein HO173_003711 [Letharia columbiana]KAF6238077.1 hypothetical protein HO173_003711 [Letharia columbiana]
MAAAIWKAAAMRDPTLLHATIRVVHGQHNRGSANQIGVTWVLVLALKAAADEVRWGGVHKATSAGSDQAVAHPLHPFASSSVHEDTQGFILSLCFGIETLATLSVPKSANGGVRLVPCVQQPCLPLLHQREVQGETTQ